MFRLFVLCAVWIIAIAAVAETLPGSQREWTDASGSKRARAILLRIEGDTLWLRRSDGKLTTTMISLISESDRQYVALWRPQSFAKSKSSSVPSSVIESVTDYVETVQQLPQWLEQSQVGANRSLVPAALVYVRVSGDFLEDYIERSVRQRKEVRDCILGARIVGESDTQGKTRLTLIPSNDQLRANIAFDGTVHSHTRGYKAPVVLHNTSNSTFQAHKLIAMDDSGLRVAPSTADVSTRLRTTRISTSLPRLRGRIATRIAWRRVSQSHDQAEAVTSDHTADDIRSDLDKRINRSVARVQGVFGAKISALETGRSPMPTDVRFRCRADCVEMALIREDATAEERKLRPPPALDNSDVSVRVHRTLLTSAIEDPQLIQNLAPLLSKLLEARATQEGDAGRAPAIGAQDSDAKWAIDLEWVSLDFKDANR
jgi:hypothetical protein